MTVFATVITLARAFASRSRSTTPSLLVTPSHLLGFRAIPRHMPFLTAIIAGSVIWFLRLGAFPRHVFHRPAIEAPLILVVFVLLRLGALPRHVVHRAAIKASATLVVIPVVLLRLRAIIRHVVLGAAVKAPTVVLLLGLRALPRHMALCTAVKAPAISNFASSISAITFVIITIAAKSLLLRFWTLPSNMSGLTAIIA